MKSEQARKTLEQLWADAHQRIGDVIDEDLTGAVDRYHTCAIAALDAAALLVTQALSGETVLGFVEQHVRLGASLKSLGTLRHDLWPERNQGVTLAWLSGRSALHAAVRFAGMVRKATAPPSNLPMTTLVAPNADPLVAEWVASAMERLRLSLKPDWSVYDLVRDEDRIRVLIDAEYEAARGEETAGPPVTPGDGQVATEHGEHRGNEFRRAERGWSVAFQGEQAWFPENVGFLYIATLVSHPGESMRATALRGMRGETSPRASHVRSGSSPHRDEALELVTDVDADDVLDEKARAACRKQLHELSRQREEAVERGDDGAIERIEAEHALIEVELKKGTGLRARRRKLGSDSERARNSVTKAIGRAIKRIQDDLPDLASHLHERIRTGSECRYDPEPGIDWRT